jgi:TonB family protein
MILILSAMAAAALPAKAELKAYAKALAHCQKGALHGAAPELQAWRAAQQGNRLDDFRAFLTNYPESLCAAPAKQWVAMREEMLAAYAAASAGAATPASVIGDPAFGISYEDYPRGAWARHDEGLTRIGYDIAPDGMIENCRIVESSGYKDLDEAACRLATQRARYRPARDDTGAPMRSVGARAIRWSLPPFVAGVSRFAPNTPDGPP